MANPQAAEGSRGPSEAGTSPGIRAVSLLLAITAGAILVHGYHPFVEDAEIYVPGIRKALNHQLYPQNDGFFASHAHMTLFPNLIAGSVRITHLPLEWALFLWQFAAIFLLLLACWHLGKLCFQSEKARWGGVALVASLLTIPVAGTALYIMDQYLNTRSLSTPAVLFLLVNVVERKFWRAGFWAVFTALIHPLMVVFGISLAAIVMWMRRPQSKTANAFAAALFPLGLFPPVSQAYRQVLHSHSYFFLFRWEWYEWLGAVAPLGLLWWFAAMGRRRKLRNLDLLCRSLIVFGLFYLAASVVLSLPAFERFAELQPMRSLHVLYILLFVFAGGLIAEFGLKDHAWRWLALFLPICGGMFYAQRQLFPATAHIEWPDAASNNAWVQAFVWARKNTPENAYFALPPDYMTLPGEDQHGFRAIAARSRMADRVKDSGAVSMFPALAETWQKQVDALNDWKDFGMPDFSRLQKEFGINWVIVQQRGVASLNCPYQNPAVKVCRLD
jgi:hypothetical protein